MKKLFAIAMFALASSFAAAADRVVLAEYTPAAVTDASTPASDKTAPTALEKGAAKVGSFLGGMLKAPAMLGKAFAGGVGAGFSAPAAPAPAPSQSANNLSSSKLAQWQEDTSATTARPVTASSTNPFAAKLASLIRRAKDQTSAPVEERSAPASAAERTPLASNLF
jgi:hypothetical protein